MRDPDRTNPGLCLTKCQPVVLDCRSKLNLLITFIAAPLCSLHSSIQGALPSHRPFQRRRLRAASKVSSAGAPSFRQHLECTPWRKLSTVMLSATSLRRAGDDAFQKVLLVANEGRVDVKFDFNNPLSRVLLSHRARRLHENKYYSPTSPPKNRRQLEF